MVKLKTVVQDNVEPEEGSTYKIESTEQIKTMVQGFEGLRVVLRSTDQEDEQVYATMLWTREVASSNSKLGAFIAAFESNDTDDWTGKTVKFVSWRSKKREIKIVK